MSHPAQEEIKVQGAVVSTAPAGFSIPTVNITLGTHAPSGTVLRYTGTAARGSVWSGETLTIDFDHPDAIRLNSELRRVKSIVPDGHPDELEVHATVYCARDQDTVSAVRFHDKAEDRPFDTCVTNERTYMATSSGVYEMTHANSEGRWSRTTSDEVRKIDSRNTNVYMIGAGGAHKAASTRSGSYQLMYDDDTADDVRHARWTDVSATSAGAWFVSSDGVVARYHESIGAWEEIRPPENSMSLSAVCAVDHGYAFLCGPQGQVWYYDDGRWSERTLPNTDDAAVDIHAFDRSHVMAVQFPNHVWSSDDGGVTWARENIPNADEVYIKCIDGATDNSECISVAGYRIGSVSQPYAAIIKDGASVWTEINIPSAPTDSIVRGVCVVETGYVWYACTRGAFVTVPEPSEVSFAMHIQRLEDAGQAAPEDDSDIVVRQTENKKNSKDPVVGGMNQTNLLQRDGANGDPLTTGIIVGIILGLLVIFALVYYYMRPKKNNAADIIN